MYFQSHKKLQGLWTFYLQYLLFWLDVHFTWYFSKAHNYHHFNIYNLYIICSLVQCLSIWMIFNLDGHWLIWEMFSTILIAETHLGHLNQISIHDSHVQRWLLSEFVNSSTYLPIFLPTFFSVSQKFLLGNIFAFLEHILYKLLSDRMLWQILPLFVS